MPTNITVLIMVDLQLSFKIGNCKSYFIFLFSGLFGYWEGSPDILYVYVNVYKEGIGDSDRHCIEPADHFEDSTR